MSDEVATTFRLWIGYHVSSIEQIYLKVGLLVLKQTQQTYPFRLTGDPPPPRLRTRLAISPTILFPKHFLRLLRSLCFASLVHTRRRMSLRIKGLYADLLHWFYQVWLSMQVGGCGTFLIYVLENPFHLLFVYL